MARQRQSLLSDLLTISIRLPLWGNVLIAGGTFLVLHYFGGSTFPQMASMRALTPELGPALVGYFGKILAYFGQFIIPSCFLLGGVAGATKRWFQKRRFRRLSGTRYSPEAIRDLSWREFEVMVGEAFRLQGYAVQETAAGADGGVDLELRMDGHLHLVQCKHWKTNAVGVKVIRELFGVMNSRGADAGYVITSGYFTNEAKEFAKKNRVDLIDGELLAELFRGLRRPVPVDVIADNDRPSETVSVSDRPRTADQRCPRCGDIMTPRFRKGGGNVFLGCTRFPSCRGTRQLP